MLITIICWGLWAGEEEEPGDGGFLLVVGSLLLRVTGVLVGCWEPFARGHWSSGSNEKGFVVGGGGAKGR